MKVYCVTFSRSLIKVLNRTSLKTDPYNTLLLAQIDTSAQPSFSPTFQALFYLSSCPPIQTVKRLAEVNHIHCHCPQMSAIVHKCHCSGIICHCNLCWLFAFIHSICICTGMCSRNTWFMLQFMLTLWKTALSGWWQADHEPALWQRQTKAFRTALGRAFPSVWDRWWSSTLSTGKTQLEYCALLQLLSKGKLWI